MKQRKNKPYKLGLIAQEVHRLNMLEGVYPETHKKVEPSEKFIRDRLNNLKSALK